MTAMSAIRAVESLTRAGFSDEQARAVVGAAPMSWRAAWRPRRTCSI